MTSTHKMHSNLADLPLKELSLFKAVGESLVSNFKGISGKDKNF